jgi:hypothetical protein
MAASEDAPDSREVAVALLHCAVRLAAADQIEAGSEIYEPLSAPEQPVGIRRAALTSLLELEGDRSPHTILEWFGSEDSVLRQVAAAQLKVLGDQQLEQLATQTDQLADSARVAVLELLTMRDGARGPADGLGSSRQRSSAAATSRDPLPRADRRRRNHPAAVGNAAGGRRNECVGGPGPDRDASQSSGAGPAQSAERATGITTRRRGCFEESWSTTKPSIR